MKETGHKCFFFIIIQFVVKTTFINGRQQYQLLCMKMLFLKNLICFQFVMSFAYYVCFIFFFKKMLSMEANTMDPHQAAP